ncbi:MAG: site-2 protease family protein [Vicinamibacterales bacterium]
MPDLASAFVYYVVFLFSTTLHEAGHAWAAKLGGDLTAYHGGQVSLDPRPHIRREPFGMVVLPLLTVVLSGWPMGFASAPYDVAWAIQYPRRAGWMALAGPTANLALVLVAAASLHLGMAAGMFAPPQSIRFDHLVGVPESGMWEGIAFFLSVLFSMNLLLATLNLIPFPPLDGSAAVPLLLSDRLADRYQRFILQNGQMFALVGMLAAWRVFDVLFDPIFLFAINILHWGSHYS